MNYRHAFHAGNFADVLKHAVLTLVLAHQTRKPKPLRVVDTHAGVGLYDLSSPEAARTSEWRTGIGRLLGPDAASIPEGPAHLLGPYLSAVRAVNAPDSLARYPGSPLIALACLRDEDRLVAAELHPNDAASLKASLAADKRAKVLAMDGWQMIRAVLPPKERRGLVLIDPPYEEAGEMQRAIEGLADGLVRFHTGTFMLWLPVKDRRAAARFKERILKLELPPEKQLWIELSTEAVETSLRLVGCALLILNPPFGLADQLKALLPFLSERLATGPGAAYAVEFIAEIPRKA